MGPYSLILGTEEKVSIKFVGGHWITLWGLEAV